MALDTTPQDCENAGKDVSLYYNVGTCAVAIWVEHLGIVGDLNLGETDDENELSRRRSSSDIKEYLPGMTDVSVSGQQITDGNYEGNAFLNSMRKGGSPRDVLVLTDDISTVNAYGYRGKWYNFDRSISGPAQGEQEQTFSLKPAACTDCAVRPVKVTVADTIGDYDPTTFTPVSSGS